MLEILGTLRDLISPLRRSRRPSGIDDFLSINRSYASLLCSSDLGPHLSIHSGELFSKDSHRVQLGEDVDFQYRLRRGTSVPYTELSDGESYSDARTALYKHLGQLCADTSKNLLDLHFLGFKGWQIDEPVDALRWFSCQDAWQGGKGVYRTTVIRPDGTAAVYERDSPEEKEMTLRKELKGNYHDLYQAAAFLLKPDRTSN